MLRTIIKIDENACNGCGLCVNACKEGAIGLVDGKAKLLRDDYCDGLGICLPVCPTGAITFEEREALPFNEEAVFPHLTAISSERQSENSFTQREPSKAIPVTESMLHHWPVQIKLAPTKAPYFENANLLIAADCTAYAYANFHQDYMKNRITLIGCPKLDSVDYAEKLTAILESNNIKSIKVVRMEVPCCRGIENAVKQALQNSRNIIPWQITVIGTNGNVIEE